MKSRTVRPAWLENRRSRPIEYDGEIRDPREREFWNITLRIRALLEEDERQYQRRRESRLADKE
jgi:hypothetical protein